MDIRHAFESHHVSLLYDSITNQQYPILTDEELAAFSENTPSASGARQMHSIVQSVYVPAGLPKKNTSTHCLQTLTASVNVNLPA